ncbi:TetR/AcrR family transcriptional regulator [Microbacterium sp. ASV49]|uniref:Helix-turn-helix domain-containing protein n=1 Tax=Microbacterium candidum TaxID=3041922 RepID=A0ABT7N3Q1_9MICO|nr:TetR/AcrR family transcriptional regulator [Microbacterium sp. ASV49]MDL9981334.1 helix-turn-helix domain-containing protein [Microbacterium sp. ASV49]
MAGLREQKRERTRALLVESANRLFRERGYAATTMADIAAASDVSTRTAFSYFPAKDDLLFPDGDERIRAAVAELEDRGDDEEPVAVLVRALQRADVAATDLVTDRASLRVALIRTEPSVRGRALRMLADAQAAIGQALHRAYPDRYTEVQAAALVGAFVGAASGAVTAIIDGMPDATEDERRAALASAVAEALAPWTSAERNA